jgi:hypothetical protein
VLTKQTYLAAIASVCLQLWPRPRRLLVFVSLVLVLLVVALGIGQVLTGGWLLWHTVLANANPLDFDYFAAMFNSLVQLNAVPVIAAASLLGLPLASARERLWRVYFVLSGVVTLVTMGKLGASSNYWLELTAASCALIGIQADRLKSRLLPGLVLASLLLAVPGYAATLAQDAQLALADEPPAQLAVAAQVAGEPGDVLTDDPGLAVLAGKRVEFEFIIFTILAAQHVWDEQPILQAIAERQFSLVILSQPVEAPEPPLIGARWSPAVREAILANYGPEKQDGGYWWYTPRG